MKPAVNVQLDSYQKEVHITSVTDLTEWIINMVIVSRPNKQGLCLDPKSLNKALRSSRDHVRPEDVLHKLPTRGIFILADEMSFCDASWTLKAVSWQPFGLLGGEHSGSNCCLMCQLPPKCTKAVGQAITDNILVVVAYMKRLSVTMTPISWHCWSAVRRSNFA